MIGTKSKSVISLFFVAVLLASIVLAFVSPLRAHALSGAEFRPGRIIDDGVFYNSGSMTVAQIQAFLNLKAPTCDTNGAQSTTYTYNASPIRVNVDGDSTVTTSRAVYGQRYQDYWASLPTDQRNPVPPGSVAPYTCINTYNQAVPAVTNGGTDLCKGSILGGTKSAAQIIYDVARACGINPQVLIVMLQKEQSLLSDDWPWGRQYTSAMGYGCPDTAACDTQYYGFFNQVYQAAKAFRRYESDPNSFNYKAGRNNFVLYNPNSACGGSTVYIENQATASLYIYTPYQPNGAALGNLYGSGDSCSSYGNRNFWRMFNDWFGSSIGCPGVDANYIYRLFRKSDSNYLYTQNPAEICQAVQYYGYTIESIASKNDVMATDPGARSVYRLSRNGVYIFTTDPVERDMAMQLYGYTYEGVAYYVSSIATGKYPMYRLSRNGRYVFTVSDYEKEALRLAGFNYEGVVYYATSPSNKVPIYRVSKNGLHLYTSSQAEKDAAVLLNGYNNEGIAFYAMSGQTGDNLTVYRLQRNHQYLNTVYPSEKSVALASGYTQETSYFFAYPANYPGTIPVYRLSNAKTGDYLLTTNTTEKDQAVQSYGYRLEGVGFNATTP